MHHGGARAAVGDRAAGPRDRHLGAERQQAARLDQGPGGDRARAADAVLRIVRLQARRAARRRLRVRRARAAEPLLRPGAAALTGRDEPVIAFLDAQPSAAEMLTDIRVFIEKWLPSFKTDNRSYLTVALGCTGGQHRSVYMAERLAQYFHPNERVVLRHREQSLLFNPELNPDGAADARAPAIPARRSAPPSRRSLRRWTFATSAARCPCRSPARARPRSLHHVRNCGAPVCVPCAGSRPRRGPRRA